MGRGTPRKYGSPFTGYRADISRDVAPLGAMTAESRDFQVSPTEGQLQLRQGYQVLLNPADTDITARTGLLGKTWSQFEAGGGQQGVAVCRNMIAAKYPYDTTDGAQTEVSIPAAAYTDEMENLGKGGILGVSSTNVHRVVGSDFSNSASAGASYRVAASIEALFKMIPVPAITRSYIRSGQVTSSGVVYNRCAFELARRYLCGGSWKLFQSARWVFAPSLNGTPIKWNGVVNDSGTAATKRVRIQPWGHLPPMFIPTLADADAIEDATNKVFYQGDARFLSVMFQNEDGSFSRPAQWASNQPYSVFVSGGFLASSKHTYSSVTYGNIPIGPNGTVRRIILGSDWVNLGTAAIDATWTPPGGNTTTGNSTADINTSLADLKIVGTIENNTDTRFKDTTRSNLSLRVDGLAVRDDHQFPLPSRYAFEMERRVGIGFCRKAHPIAMFLCPLTRKGGTEYELNLADDDALLYGTVAQAYRLFRSTAGVLTLYLKQGDIAANTNYTENAIVTIGGVALALCTLRQLQEAIFLTSSASNGGRWTSQILGQNGNIPCSNLQPTALQVGGCTVTAGNLITSVGVLTTNATAPNDFSDVGIGMKVRVVSGAGVGAISANLVVIGKDNNTTLRLGDTNGLLTGTCTTGTANANVLEFWSDTGDDAWNTNASWLLGNIRSFGPTFLGPLAFNGRYMDTVGIDKQRILYTSSAPGQASMAAQSFFNNQANVKSVPSAAGNFMGSVPIPAGNLLAYSRAMYVLANRKGGTSGEDFDYHVYPLNLRRGCTQYGTLAAGNGWAIYRTLDGYIVTDGEREVNISGALYDPGTGYGIITDMLTNYGDSDLGGFSSITGQYAHCIVAGNAIHASFSVGGSFPFRRAVYSFAASAGLSGLAAVLKDGREPYPWSAPLTQQVNCFGVMPDGSLFAAHERYGGLGSDPQSATTDGTIWKLDTAVTRLGGVATTQMDDGPSFNASIALDATALTATVSAADFKRIPIGAFLKGANITGFLIVTGKNADGITLVVSGTFTTSGAATRTVYGQEIGYASSAYLATDQLDSIENKKSFMRMAVRLAIHTAATLQAQFYWRMSRNSVASMLFSGSAIVNGRHVPTNRRVEAPLIARSEGECGEFVLSVFNPSVSAARQEIYGVDAEYDVHDSPR